MSSSLSDTKKQASKLLGSLVDETRDQKQKDELRLKIHDTPDILKEVVSLIRARTDTCEKKAIFDSPGGQELFKHTLFEFINLNSEQKPNYSKNFALFISEAEHGVLDLTSAPKRGKHAVDNQRLQYLGTEDGMKSFGDHVVKYLRPDITPENQLAAQTTIPFGTVISEPGLQHAAPAKC